MNPFIKRIILISPDHYQSNFQDGSLAFTTDSDWDGLFGIVPSDKKFIDHLVQGHREIQNKRTHFLNEHGIYTEIPFIAYYFPGAKIIPIILKNDYNYANFVSLGKSFEFSATDIAETLLVVSSDFSHHATHASAQKADKESIDVLKNLSDEQFSNLQNDCRSCIAFMTGFFSQIDPPPLFHLIENKDSTDFGGKDEDVTSYVSGYFTSSK